MFFKKDKEVKSIAQVFLEEVGPAIIEYSEWYDQNGLHLPPDYGNDPSAWSEALHKIVRAIEILNEKDSEFVLKDGTVINDYSMVYTHEDTEAIREGMAIFAKQILYLTDTVKPLRPAH